MKRIILTMAFLVTPTLGHAQWGGHHGGGNHGGNKNKLAIKVAQNTAKTLRQYAQETKYESQTIAGLAGPRIAKKYGALSVSAKALGKKVRHVLVPALKAGKPGVRILQKVNKDFQEIKSLQRSINQALRRQGLQPSWEVKSVFQKLKTKMFRLNKVVKKNRGHGGFGEFFAAEAF